MVTLDELSVIFPIYLYTKTKRATPLKHGNAPKRGKIASLRSLFKYFYRSRKNTPIRLRSSNPPKIHEKPHSFFFGWKRTRLPSFWMRLTAAPLFHERQKEFHIKTKLRDTAILTRSWEPASVSASSLALNIDDFDFSVNGF
jgi:hypothetical protein